MTTDSARGLIEGTGDTRTARFERIVAHTPEAVWEALTSPDALDRWFMTAALEPRVGGTASFDTGEARAKGTVSAWDPPRELAYTWPFPEDGGAHVTWTLEPRDGGAATRLVLVHTALPADWAAGYGGGWHAYLERLESHLAGDEPQDWAERMQELQALYASPSAPAG
jgi:uncharacterized protein YndB with AHSA1/START domain